MTPIREKSFALMRVVWNRGHEGYGSGNGSGGKSSLNTRASENDDMRFGQTTTVESMIPYDYYADVPEDAIASFVSAARLCRLVTVGADGTPHLGLYPFAPTTRGFELHLNNQDEQIADLRQRPRCLLEVDEPLSDIPSHWIDEENGSMATAYHRTVTFECGAEVIDDRDAIAAQQQRLMARYQPEGRHAPVQVVDERYAGMLSMLAAIQLTMTTRKVKFKLGQNRPFALRRNLVERLRARGQERDLRSADALQWTIDLEWTTKGRGKR